MNQYKARELKEKEQELLKLTEDLKVFLVSLILEWLLWMIIFQTSRAENDEKAFLQSVIQCDYLIIIIQASRAENDEKARQLEENQKILNETLQSLARSFSKDSWSCMSSSFQVWWRQSSEGWEVEREIVGACRAEKEARGRGCWHRRQGCRHRWESGRDREPQRVD